MLSPHTPYPTEDQEADEYREFKAQQNLWEDLRTDSERFIDSHVADPRELLTRIGKLVAQSDHDWDTRRVNGMRYSKPEHQASVFREIYQLFDTLVEGLAHAEVHPYNPRVPTNPNTYKEMRVEL